MVSLHPSNDEAYIMQTIIRVMAKHVMGVTEETESDGQTNLGELSGKFSEQIQVFKLCQFYV
jgi:hypothetical protein